MVMTTYVAIVKAKTKWAKATVSPATQASLVLVVLESHQNLRPHGGVDHRPTQVLILYRPQRLTYHWLVFVGDDVPL